VSEIIWSSVAEIVANFESLFHYSGFFCPSVCLFAETWKYSYPYSLWLVFGI